MGKLIVQRRHGVINTHDHSLHQDNNSLREKKKFPNRHIVLCKEKFMVSSKEKLHNQKPIVKQFLEQGII